MMILFIISMVLILYIYIGYPLLLQLLPKKKRKLNFDASFTPSISILIAAFNEEDCIEETLLNKLQLDYPADKLEILVISDASTDNTNKLVETIALSSSIPIRLYQQQSRQGKTAGLNRLVKQAKGDILVFSDANSLYDKYAIKQLIQQFQYEDVGYISGQLIYTHSDGTVIGNGCSKYMQYENWLRQQETNISSIIGVDGGIDAMRKSLYTSLNADQLPDFVQPLKVIEQGYSVCYEPSALLYEKSLKRPEKEFKMRVRVCLRALWALFDMRHLLNPLRYGLFSIQLLSHKLLRYLAFIPQFVVFISNITLINQGLFFQIIFVLQIIFYANVYLGFFYRNRPESIGILSMPYYLFILNISAAVAFYKFIHNEKIIIWAPREGQF